MTHKPLKLWGDLNQDHNSETAVQWNLNIAEKQGPIETRLAALFTIFRRRGG